MRLITTYSVNRVFVLTDENIYGLKLCKMQKKLAQMEKKMYEDIFVASSLQLIVNKFAVFFMESTWSSV